MTAGQTGWFTGSAQRGRRRVSVVSLAVAAAWFGIAGCTNSSTNAAAPPVPTRADGSSDPALVLGRDVYVKRCASCHGSAGKGGAGPNLTDGRLARDFPDPAAQVALVSNGRKGMPAFGAKLGAADIEAVVRYTRELLAAAGTPG